MRPGPKNTKEEMARYREMIQERKPWQLSTGPRTAAGRRAVSGNAVTHGLETAAFRAAMRYVDRMARILLDC